MNRKILLLSIFVLSGFAGLIYQSIWSQYLGIYLGHAAYAQALVLSIFMGGMALGAMWISRVGDRWRNLIFGYAVIEMVIGILGFAFHWLFTNVADFSYQAIIPSLGGGAELARWLIAGLLILPQTILLGMTFPLMSGGLIRRYPNQDGDALGGLYFTNSIGAAFGALASPFVLLPAVGLPGAMVVAGCLNLVVAVFAFWLARVPEPVKNSIPSGVGEKISNDSVKTLRVVLWATGISGAASFAYEIIWIRMLSLAVGSTLHAFEVMLASFIGGIALGGLWVRKRADNANDPLRLVGWMQVAMGVAALLSLFVYGNSFRWVGWLLEALKASDAGYDLFTLGTTFIAISIMMPAAFFAGTTLPLFTVALLRSGHGERSIGQVYGWNTIGTILGVLLTMHFLIPMTGLKLSLVLAALVDIVIGFYLLRTRAIYQKDLTQIGVAAGVVLVCAWAALTKVTLDPRMLASGVFRSGQTLLQEGAKVLFYRDGKTSTVSVAAFNGNKLSIATNGKSDAAITMDDSTPSADEPTMTLLGAMPLALHEEPQEIGVIGFGSGMTTHTLLADARVKRVDTIEIEPAMIQGARLFGERVGRAFNDPRSNIIIDDAKSYFSSSRAKYDVIISEPSNPWISGIGGLFAKEFYQLVPKYLKEDGLFVQWIQLYEINDKLVASIVNAMTPAFDDYSAWLSNSGDLILVAKHKGKLADVNAAHLFQEKMGDELKRLGLTDVSQVNLRKVADASVLRGYGVLYNTNPNSYYQPLLSLEAPKTRFMKVAADTLPVLASKSNMFLEAIGVQPVLPDDVLASDFHHFSAEDAIRLARINGDFLAGRSSEVSVKGFVNPLDNAILLKEAASGVCERSTDASARNKFARHVLEVSKYTMAGLSAQLQKGVWSDPKWLPCSVESLQEDERDAMEFLDAMASRDWDQASALGERWLSRERDARWLPMNQKALSAVLMDLARKNKWSDLRMKEKELGASVTSTEADLEARMLMIGMAEVLASNTAPQ